MVAPMRIGRRGPRTARDEGDRRGGRGGAARGAVAARVLLVRVVDLVTLGVVLLIVIGIALVLLKANPDNAIVGTVRDGAKYLAKPFDAIFQIDKRRTEIAVNWGIAAAVYLVVGRVVSGLLSR